MAGNDVQLMLYLAEGEKKQAMKYRKRLQTYSVKSGIPQFSTGLEAINARLAIEEGNLASAVLWAQRRKLKANEPFSLLFAMEVMIQARLYLARKKFQNAIQSRMIRRAPIPTRRSKPLRTRG